jgi:FixJ family two-component response regulator
MPMVEAAVVHIVDDEPSIRDSLAMLLRSVGIESRGWPDARSFLAELGGFSGACVVADVRMPGMSGLDLQEELRRRGVTVPVIIITGHGDVAMAVRAMKAGAADFLEKPFNDQALLDAVNRALAIPEFRVMSTDAAGDPEIIARLETLTPREREVLVLVAEGRPNKTVATRLGLSTRTVEVHRAKVMEKMRARSLAELVRMTIAAGVTQTS